MKQREKPQRNEEKTTLFIDHVRFNAQQKSLRITFHINRFTSMYMVVSVQKMKRQTIIHLFWNRRSTLTNGNNARALLNILYDKAIAVRVSVFALVCIGFRSNSFICDN